ncbi:FG-GAP repeat domain-containing protein [Lysobacter niastensis]|uniref:VCBS repeat-containing protein n=1 Tax=Lysobacter niastensis TaxID=380629 RepID=A0ABS0BC20_9GAMM|nr:VCBS repeat-containing protein [Lysobacter niastensis]MBF6025227.1 VCBS repeat-containing protein [Lysobacter niastensis]
MHRTGERRAAAGSGSLKGFAVLAVLALAGCGGGGGGGSKPSGANTSPPTPVPPPPPPSPYEINRAFRFDAAVFYPPALDFLATATSIGDINSDGRPDVVLATEGVYREEDRSRIFIYPQLPGGLLGAAFKSPFLDTYPWQPIGMTLGDLDGDGAPEIFVGHQEGLTVFKFHKDSQAITKVLHPDPHGFSTVATLDVDNDGRLDVVAQTSSYGAVIYRGDGLGGVSRLRDLPTPLRGYNYITAEDMNGDGREDLLLIHQGFHWWLMLNDGAGGLAPPREQALPRWRADNMSWTGVSLGVGDFNRDGRKDVAVSLSSNRPAGMAIFLQQADGQFVLDKVMESHDLPGAVMVADMDGNGLDDVLTLHNGFSTMGVYLQGPGGLEAETRVSIGVHLYSPTSRFRPDGFALGDVNSDGCKDAVIADYIHGVMIFHGRDCKRPAAATAVSRAMLSAVTSKLGGG